MEISGSLTEAANFSVYFTGNSTIQSTPHLYISSLATWGSESKLSRGWKKYFPGILSVKRTGNLSGSALLMMLNGHTDYVESVAFSSDGTRIVSGSRDKLVGEGHRAARRGMYESLDLGTQVFDVECQHS